MKKKMFINAILWSAIIAIAQQPLETEVAHLLRAKSFEVNATYEYQTSVDGRESALPFAFAYGLYDRLEIMVEPVPSTHINPSAGKGIKGPGDTEATLTYNFFKEKNSTPALAIAGEIKFPTAKNTLIGTGKTDYTIYLIATKSMGKFENHVNVGYAIVGQPAGVELNNIYNFAVASEFHLNKKFDFVGEILGNTSAMPQEGNTEIEKSTSPEISGGEIVGMLGVRYFLNSSVFAALGVTYDNNNAVLIRPGFTCFF
jgi:hypothetical protein